MSPREYIALFKANVGRNSEAGWGVCIPCHGESDASTDYEQIDESEEVLPKGVFDVIIIKHDGNYFRITQSRSGSAFTDWYFDEADIEQVTEQEKVVTVRDWAEIGICMSELSAQVGKDFQKMSERVYKLEARMADKMFPSPGAN